MDDAQKIAAKFAALGGKASFGETSGSIRKITVTVRDKGKAKTRAAGGGSHTGPGGDDPEVPTHQEVIAWIQDYERGTIISHVNGQCFGVYGPVWRKWNKLGGWGSFLGWPASDLLPTQIQGGLYAHFANGTVALKPNADEAFEVHGAILDKWDSLGDTAGILGFPTTDEGTCKDSVGHFNHFTGAIGPPSSSSKITTGTQQTIGINPSGNLIDALRHQGASVYSKPSLGAHEVHGPIHSFWGTAGFETNASLGYPIGDELRAPHSADRFQDFENGVVFWRFGDEQASEMSPLTLTIDGHHTPTPPDEVLQQMKHTLTEVLEGIDLKASIRRIRIKSGPSFRSLPAPFDLKSPAPLSHVSDYSVDSSGRVHNRQYRLTVSVTAEVDGAPDFDVMLDIDVEIYLDRQDGPAGTIKARLGRYYYSSHMGAPAIDSVVQMVDHCFLEPALARLERDSKTVLEIPKDAPDILSVKVMADGTLMMFAAPLF